MTLVPQSVARNGGPKSECLNRQGFFPPDIYYKYRVTGTAQHNRSLY